MQLEIRDLTQTNAGRVPALRDVSLTLPQGMSGLLGPRGAGKSTLLRILATLQRPQRGSIRLGAIDLLERPDEIRRTLGYLPQEFELYPAVNAEDLLAHYALLRGLVRHWERREIVEALLARVGLWELRRQCLGGYSRAMRLRFALAAVLLGNPKLLLVDQPTTGLAPGDRRLFFELLAELGEGRILVLATDVLDDVSDLCNRIAIIDRGRILLEESGGATRARTPAAKRA